MAAAPNSSRIGSYFLIGRHYCTLQSRFGCHFCTVEGFAGDRSEENYALMQFMGGAADASLRHERVKLCAETLERCGFITSVRGDILLARKEHMSRKKALTTLSMLGYMLMHTRQLDMAMGSAEMRRRYADTFRSDLARLARIGERPDQHDPETTGEDSHG